MERTRNIPTGVSEHIWHAKGAKTVCTSHVLAAFGIDPGAYHYSGQHEQRAGVLRRHGFAVRSRASRFKGCKTVGQVRARIAKKVSEWGDPPGVRYMVCVVVGADRHALLLDSDGSTIVDTWPRKRDRRRVRLIHAVFPK